MFKPISPLRDKRYEHSEQTVTDKNIESDSKKVWTIKKCPILRKIDILSFTMIFK